MDSFLLKLGNLNVQPHNNDDDEAQALSSYVNDLLSISHAPPELKVTEENIATYIAGYIGNKTQGSNAYLWKNSCFSWLNMKI